MISRRSGTVLRRARFMGTHLLNEKSMKTMTCRQLGGTCDAPLTADSWDAMVKKMTAHVLEKHPDVAQKMAKMHEQDPKKWGAEMKPKWDAAPNV